MESQDMVWTLVQNRCSADHYFDHVFLADFEELSVDIETDIDTINTFRWPIVS